MLASVFINHIKQQCVYQNLIPLILKTKQKREKTAAKCLNVFASQLLPRVILHYGGNWQMLCTQCLHPCVFRAWQIHFSVLSAELVHELVNSRQNKMADECGGRENSDSEGDEKCTGFLFPSILPPRENEGNYVAPEVTLSGFGSFKDGNGKQKDDIILRKISITSQDASLIGHQEGKFDSDHLENSKKKSKRRATNPDSDYGYKESKKRKKNEKKKKEKKKKERKKKKIKENIQRTSARYDKTKPDTIWLENTKLSIEEAFRLDKRDTKDNLLFDTFYRLDIANYHRKNEIVCLGLKKGQHFEWIDERTKKKKKSKSSGIKNRYFNALKSSKASKNKEDYGEHKLSLYMTLDEKNVNSSKLNPLEFDDKPNLEYADSQLSEKSEFTLKTEYFNEKLRENPKDVDLWIQFAKLQDKSFVNLEETNISSTFDSEHQNKRNHRAIVEKKLNILEKALSCNQDSILLMIEYMECCREILDPTDVNTKWKQFSFQNLNKGLLWENYLMFLQSDLSNFSTSNVIANYNKCFKTMLAIAEGEIKTHDCEPDHLQHMVAIFVQYCQFLYQSDLPEKALASFQAMIEFNCFAPEDINGMPASSQKTVFEAFWDSDFPRFGDEAATGWENWLRNQRAGGESACNAEATSKSVVDVSNEVIDLNLTRAGNWLKIENERRFSQWIPLRQIGNGDDVEDPDRVILADDVISCLFRLKSEGDILDLFLLHLSFLGVPINRKYISEFLYKKLLGFGCIPEYMDVSAGTVAGEFLCLYETRYPSTQKLKGLQLNENRIRYIEEVFKQSLELAEKYSKLFTNSLSQCWLLFQIMTIKDSSLALDSRSFKETVKKTKKLGKSLLKKAANRNCLELWLIFAEFEYNYGTQEEALRIFDMTISMCVAENAADLTKVAWVFKNYVLFLMQAIIVTSKKTNQLENKIVNLLLRLSSEEAPGQQVVSTETAHPLRVRRVKETFKEKFTRFIDEANNEKTGSKFPKISNEKIDWVLCFALFMYFCEDFHSANEVLYEAQRNIMLSDEQVLSLIYLKLNILKFSCKKQSSSVAELRSALWEATVQFPENLCFNEMLMEFENKGIASLRIRRHHHSILTEAKSLMPWVLAINYEEMRLKTLRTEFSLDTFHVTNSGKVAMLTILPNTGIANRIRGLYNRATSSREGRHCVALWRNFLKFEIKNGDYKKSKNVFYKALQCCPWSKELYLDAIAAHQDDFENIIDIMQEKEVRIRIPVEELEVLMDDSS